MTLQQEIYDITTQNLLHYDTKKRAYHSEWYARSVL